ncbi:hypothetical protein [Lysinibacillus sp. TE18511]
MEWRLGDSSGVSDRGTKAKSITSCDNAFVTNIVSAQAAHRTPQRKHPAGTEINPRYDKVSFLNKI